MDEHFQQAIAAHAAGDFETAERHYLKVAHAKNALHNLGVLYRVTQRYEEAEQAFRRILAQFPDDAQAQNSLSHCLLAMERFEEAWPFWEARRRVGHGAIWEPATETPEWRGESLRGKRLAVLGEHGLGDQVLFGRYLPLLRAAGAEIVVACDVGALGRLFENAGFAAAPYSREAPTLPDGVDAWVFIGSLPLRMALQAPPPPEFLKLPAQAGGGLGVIGQGYSGYAYDRYRSMPAEAAQRLSRLGRSLAPEATGARDVLDTAQIMAGLDAVVSTDTLAANLSATLGKRTLVLLPKVAPCWRWGRDGRSPWYPQAELYRQGASGDWAGVLDRVEADLAGNA